MRSYASFLVSKELREENFPQPELEVGQVWYSANGHPSIIVRRWSLDAWIACQIGSGVVSPPFTDEELKGAYYAPTLEDICDSTSIVPKQTDQGDWTAGLFKSNRLGYYFERYTRTVDTYECPIEAVADAWINLKHHEEV